MQNSFLDLSRQSDPDRLTIQRAYRFWAPLYDLVCEGLFMASRRRAASLAGSIGDDILEIGVGTGLSLGDYGRNVSLAGIDLSPEMIARAEIRAAKGMLARLRALRLMDAHDLAFSDARFDVVVAQFLITLVENPERVLDEALRVTRPGGAIILVNHFHSETGFAAWLERRLAPLVRPIGLRPDFPFQRIERWAAAQGVEVVSRTASGIFGAFSIVRLRAPESRKEASHA
jgi:phosphatidylethanolamine/phosphatidyl-N-methylethanolamine N-methyltransferase